MLRTKKPIATFAPHSYQHYTEALLFALLVQWIDFEHDIDMEIAYANFYDSFFLKYE